MWDLWWIKWHWDRSFSEFLSFQLSISFHCGSPYWYIAGGWIIGLLVAAVQRHRLTPQTLTTTSLYNVLFTSFNVASVAFTSYFADDHICIVNHRKLKNHDLERIQWHDVHTKVNENLSVSITLVCTWIMGQMDRQILDSNDVGGTQCIQLQGAILRNICFPL
jgi:hypothetical protein